MVQLKLKFTQEKETKNTYRYSEVGTDAMKFLYIAKKDIGSPAPKDLTITIEG